ncbi:NAD-dependent epimerase/dehydratase family protein [Sulfitobacter sediminilitoris]|uniref:NAD-dependent epimerase/dehydratase family protein n=1 Tax=Sulfitobacter sediminilitoris TaxID=2698830 RepID=UPI001954AD4E|nr:NAD-dependent epimerase/dehydratase family protein [Sulfitobacter sediminilitoris]
MDSAIVTGNLPVLVTGSSGFIGGSISNELKRSGVAVVTLDVNGTPDIKADAADPAVLADVRRGAYSAVVHQAGISNTLEKDEELLYQHNTAKPLAIADACSSSATLFIYASSFSVYGATGRRPLRESDLSTTTGPLNAYARSKLLLDERMSCRFGGGNWIGLRYTNVFGPREPISGRMASVISRWLCNSARREPIEIFEGTEDSGRDFVEVHRIARVILRRILDDSKDSARGVFNMGSGTTVTFGELLNWCREFAGEAIKVRTVPFHIGEQYQHWTSVDMGLLAQHYPDQTVSDKESLKEYARYCWASHK